MDAPRMKLTTKQSIYSKRSVRGSFSMWDLFAILMVLAIFGLWFVFAHTGERGRIYTCTNNLRLLGQATLSFANDHDDGLPAATIDTRYMKGGSLINWDTQLGPYIEPRLAQAKSVYEKNLLWPVVQQRLLCPSDPFKRVNPRSYAMSWRRWLYGWPPTPRDGAGVGVMWNQNTISKFLDPDLAQKAITNRDLLPLLKLSIVPDPAHTLLFSEFISPDNRLWSSTCGTINCVDAQKQAFNGNSSHFHFGKFNYLMADGHVELLSASQTDGSDGESRNIWNINPGD